MADQVHIEDVKEGDEIPKLTKNCSTQQLVHCESRPGDQGTDDSRVASQRARFGRAAR